MRETALICAGLLAWAGASAGAELDLQASVDKGTVGLGQELVLTVTVTGGFQNLPTPELPEMANFSVYPSGTSTSFSFVNGRVTSSKISRYVLVPRKEGRLTIPAISVEHGGKEYLTDPLQVTVTAAPAAPPVAPQAPSGVKEGQLLLKASLDKKRAYVGEQVTLDLRFCRRVAVVSSRLIPPATTGFWVEELPGEKNYYSVEDGLQYQVTEIAMALFPTTEGTLEIGPATWECTVREPAGRRDPFDLLNLGFARTRETSVRSEGLKIEVLPLPASGKPDGFAGAVGRYEVSASVDKMEVKAEEPLTLTVTLSGEGNINAVGDLRLPEMSGFRSYDSGGSTDLTKEGGVVRGSRSFSRVYIPSVPGEYVFPPVSVPYFDPAAGRYAVASSDKITVSVVPGEGGASAAGPGGEDLHARDIRYIKTGVPSFKRVGERLYARRGFLLLQLLAPAMVLCAYAYRLAREKAAADPARARARVARKRARNGLSRVRSLAQDVDASEVWKALASVLRGYIADVTGASAAGLTMEGVRRGLGAIGVGEDLVNETLAFLERCDAAAFAPRGELSPPSSNAGDEVADLIGRLDGARRVR